MLSSHAQYRMIVCRSACVLLAAAFSLTINASTYASGLKLGDLCRLKGQETNTLHGWGIVVGLRGTGDSDSAPTWRALAEMIKKMGGPMSTDGRGTLNLEEVASAKNVAMVFVNAEIPSVGAQAGDALDVSVSAISAKSLEGGTLMLTQLVGPRPDDPTVYASAQGPLQLSPDGTATGAMIQGGAKMETSVKAAFLKEGKITLVLDRDFASFDTVQRVVEQINSFSALTLGDVSGYGSEARSTRTEAQAIDQLHIEVKIPELYQKNPIKFITVLMNIPILLSSHSTRVVINERDGIVVIGKDVEIAPVLVTHRNLRIEAGGSGGFVEIGDNADEEANAKLKSLADALNAIDAPTDDLIAIIKTLKRKGDLFGEVVFQ